MSVWVLVYWSVCKDTPLDQTIFNLMGVFGTEEEGRIVYEKEKKFEEEQKDEREITIIETRTKNSYEYKMEEPNQISAIVYHKTKLGKDFVEFNPQ